jgi:ABC-2 type transport system ATP-binding protein
VNTPVTTHELTRRFRSTLALDGLNLEVAEGAVYALVGPNGAGKTTAIQILMNIQRPSGGRAEVLGIDSRRLAGRNFERIGYVSENQQMPWWMTPAYLFRYLKPFYPAWDDALAAELLRQLDLPPDRPLRTFSRGMRIKAALASSLAYRPSLIVLDEPFGGLDALVRDELAQTLLERADAATVLISSHDLSDIESFASHVGYLDHGRLTLSGEMNSINARFRQVEVTLDSAPERTDGWPGTWISGETSPSLVRFVETEYDREKTEAEIRRMFSGVRSVAMEPMPLRAIFIALAKTGRRRAAA